MVEKKKTTKTPSKKKVSRDVSNDVLRDREVVYLKIDKITPYWRNPRTHDLDMIVSSIRKYGFTEPLILDHEQVIVAGHGRFKALVKMKYKGEVPCVIVKDLSDEAVKEYRIVDNKVQEASEWKTEDLYAELRELPGLDDIQVFFKDSDLSNLFEETSGQNVDEVTPADIAKAEQKIEGIGNTTVKKTQVLCPHCGEEFEVQT